MKRIILGTAGHIDHGKTTFIKALTGIDCDRLKEEKERGITIELGYAHLMLPSGIKVGIVDVPGHEKFVSKMVAGAAGIDVVALIISADEGIKPQTKEHLYICDLLGIKKGIIVLTKKDLVDDELLELQKEDIKEFVKNSTLKDAPIVAVSSITKDGIQDFIKILDRIAKDIVEKPVDMPFRMPIDAVLTIKGFGTVVRGTVISGKITVGEEVIIEPLNLKLRVRSLQSHGQNVSEGRAGERIAINFPDVEKEELERGMVVVGKGFFEPTQSILVDFHYLEYNDKPLKPKFVCQFHVLTSKVNAEVYLLNKEMILPGESSFGIVKLAKPIIVAHGDRYVIRGYGIYTTIGGGKVLNPHIPTFKRSYFTEEYLKLVSGDNIEDIISLFIKESENYGITKEKLLGMMNIEASKIEKVLESLNNKILVKDEKKKLYHKDVVNSKKQKALEIIHKFHKENPLKIGINKDELFSKLVCTESLFEILIKMLVDEKKIKVQGDLVSDINFKIEDEGKGLLVKIEEIYKQYGLTPEDPKIVAESLKIDIKKLKDALATLVRQGRIQKINEDYFITTDSLDSVKAKLLDFFSKKQILTPQDMREMFDISRKYIIPLLEFLDKIKFTIRLQEGRKLRKQ